MMFKAEDFFGFAVFFFIPVLGHFKNVLGYVVVGIASELPVCATEAVSTVEAGNVISLFLILRTWKIGQIASEVDVVAVVAVGFPGDGAVWKVLGQAVVYEGFLFACYQAKAYRAILGLGIFKNDFQGCFKPVFRGLFHWKGKTIAASVFVAVIIAEKDIFLNFEFCIIFFLQQKKICN